MATEHLAVVVEVDMDHPRVSELPQYRADNVLDIVLRQLFTDILPEMKLIHVEAVEHAEEVPDGTDHHHGP